MKGAVNLQGLFFHLRDKKKRDESAPLCLHHPAAYKQLFKVSPGKWPMAFASPESPVNLPNTASFPRALVVCHLVSTCSYTHTQLVEGAGQGVYTCCPVNKIPQSDAETSSFTQQSFPQVWEHECWTKHADCDTTESAGQYAERCGAQRGKPGLPHTIHYIILSCTQTNNAFNAFSATKCCNNDYFPYWLICWFFSQPTKK